MNFKERLEYARTKRAEQRRKAKKKERWGELLGIFLFAPFLVYMLLHIIRGANSVEEIQGWEILGFIGLSMMFAFILYLFIHTVMARIIHCKQLVCSRLLVVNNEKDREVVASLGPRGLEIIGPDGKGSVIVTVKDGGGHIELKRGGDNFHRWHETYPDDPLIEGNYRTRTDKDEVIHSISGDEDEVSLVELSTFEARRFGNNDADGGSISVSMEVEDRHGDKDNLPVVELLAVGNKGRIELYKRDGKWILTETTELFGNDKSEHTMSERLAWLEDRVYELEKVTGKCDSN